LQINSQETPHLGTLLLKSRGTGKSSPRDALDEIRGSTDYDVGNRREFDSGITGK
jgi:hypothetical protein